MNDRKNREKNGVKPRSIIERRSKVGDLEETAVLKKLEALDSLFAESKEYPELFHQMYVKPLLEAGVSMDTAFDLLVSGAVNAN